MESYSRTCSAQNGTLRLPQALLLLLSPVLAGPTSDQVTQSGTHLARWQDIKNIAYHLIQLFNPFTVSGYSTSSTAVGMVKVTALCGIGSALWLWSKQKGKGMTGDAPHRSDLAIGKTPQWTEREYLSDHVAPQYLAMLDP